MAGKKGSLGENSKKAAGQARKAEAAAEKQAAKDREAAAKEESKWQQGSKDSKKAEAAAAKAAEAARKKAEKAALLKEEEASLPSKGTNKANAKTATKKTRGTLDLSSLDAPADNKSAPALNATGIDNALDALSLTSTKAKVEIDRHPERRFPAAYKKFEEQRLEEMKNEKGLRRDQKIQQIRKEFDKHPDNPFNQVSGKYNTTKEELREIRDQEKEKTEARLTSPVNSP